MRLRAALVLCLVMACVPARAGAQKIDLGPNLNPKQLTLPAKMTRPWKPIDFKRPPAAVQMQGLWVCARPPHDGDLSRLVVQGNQLSVSVRTAGGDAHLGQVTVATFSGDDDTTSTWGATRLVGIFTTDTAEVEVIVTLKERGTLVVDQVVRYRSTATLNRWHRYEFREGYEAGAMKPMSKENSLPEFPWPPPKASMRALVPEGLAVTTDPQETYGSSFDRIMHAANAAGFFDVAVYAIPSDAGFVVVTRLENIREDGKPLDDRFSVNPRPDRPRSVGEWLASLAKAPPGLYRVIVLAVTTQPVTEADTEPSQEEADRWLHKGARDLPREMRVKSMAGGHCEALIYEFRVPDHGQGGPQMFADNLGALRHVSQAGIWRGDLP
jgi:hypothetical protein